MRAIVILVLIAVALALTRLLVNDVSRAVLKAWKRGGGSEAGSGGAERQTEGKQGRLARDPVSGSYIDEESAVRAEIDGRIYFFESDANRRTFLNRRSTA